MALLNVASLLKRLATMQCCSQCDARCQCRLGGWGIMHPDPLPGFVCCRQALLNTVQGMQLRLEGLEDWRGRLQGARLRSPPS